MSKPKIRINVSGLPKINLFPVLDLSLVSKNLYAVNEPKMVVIPIIVK
ncbi:hypothetical protein GCM10023330_05460 [Litoribaculum gwangyangense]|uniref:Uncharacterized protein n=1 Tax=Litoribaculum gwangyangense TaxID=1130722 RepID=A0ABP9C316_9FLAO